MCIEYGLSLAKGWGAAPPSFALPHPQKSPPSASMPQIRMPEGSNISVFCQRFDFPYWFRYMYYHFLPKKLRVKTYFRKHKQAGWSDGWLGRRGVGQSGGWLALLARAYKARIWPIPCDYPVHLDHLMAHNRCVGILGDVFAPSVNRGQRGKSLLSPKIR